MNGYVHARSQVISEPPTLGTVMGQIMAGCSYTYHATEQALQKLGIPETVRAAERLANSV